MGVPGAEDQSGRAVLIKDGHIVELGRAKRLAEIRGVEPDSVLLAVAEIGIGRAMRRIAFRSDKAIPVPVFRRLEGAPWPPSHQPVRTAPSPGLQPARSLWRHGECRTMSHIRAYSYYSSCLLETLAENVVFFFVHPLYVNVLSASRPVADSVITRRPLNASLGIIGCNYRRLQAGSCSPAEDESATTASA